MQDSHRALVDEAIDVYNEIVRTMQAQTAPDWLTLDLTMAQLKTLLALAFGGRVTIGKLAEQLGVGLPTASHLTERLVQAGLAERIEDADDRRRTLAQLSVRGSELVARLRQGRRELLQSQLAQLTTDELTGLLQGLHGLARVVHLAQALEER
jgi:DNA-binding MarR family transcriptional regulator